MVLNRSKLDELGRAHDIRSEAALARLIGVEPSTLWRASKGRPVSTDFMARVKIAFPKASLDTLFEAREVA